MSPRPYRLFLRGFRTRAFAHLGKALTALRKAARSVSWSIAPCGSVLFQGAS